jgi:diguanylate cyclase (GGDEF)-like protein
LLKSPVKQLTSHIIETIEILEEVTGMQNLERTLHKIVRFLEKNIKCQTCAIIQINPKTESLEIINSFGLSWKFCKEYRKQMISDVIHDLIWRGKDVLLNQKKGDKKLVDEFKLEKDFKSCFCVGLSASYRPLGMLYLDSQEASHFNPEQQLIIRMFAKIISLALMKDRLLKDIQKLAILDENTGVIKYSYFYGRLQNAISQSKRLNENLAIILLDVVKYDKIIYSYGVDVGNQLMNEIIMIIRNHLRNYDGLSKFGTDEVIVSLPGASGEEAYRCAVKLDQIIKNTGFTSNSLKINVSIGIASYPENAKELSSLLTATKNALVEAKRNREKNIYWCETFFT